MERFDYIVVGAGPAGLAFASTTKNSNVLVIDCGKDVSQRNRFNSEECVQGAGGAGLFSDGKFSFYPAGTNIWKQDEWKLKDAYQMLDNDLNAFGRIPDFPNLHQPNKIFSDDSGWTLKPYKSTYLSLENRLDLVEKLTERCPRIYYQTEFLNFKKTKNGFLVKVKDIPSSAIYHIQTQKLVLAGGRFMPLFLSCPKRFRRYEFGFRVIGPSHLIKKGTQLTDPKYVFDSPHAEYRTFCWCENGEVIKTSFNGIETFSGRADCPSTGITNFGFNIRIKKPSQISQEDFHQLINMPAYHTGIKMFVQTLNSRFGSTISPIIQYGCAMLQEKFKDLICDDVRVMGPTIEGVGQYPDVENHFQLSGENEIFVIGDCSGNYRGIVPSMLAGYSLATTENKIFAEKTELALVES